MLSGWKRWDKDNGKDSGTDLYYLGTQDEGWARTSFQWLKLIRISLHLMELTKRIITIRMSAGSSSRQMVRQLRMIPLNITTRPIPLMDTEECLI